MSTSELAVKKGDTVVVPGGAVRRVGYVGTGRRGGVRIGVIVPGQKELTFYSVGQLQIPAPVPLPTSAPHWF